MLAQKFGDSVDGAANQQPESEMMPPPASPTNAEVKPKYHEGVSSKLRSDYQKQQMQLRSRSAEFEVETFNVEEGPPPAPVLTEQSSAMVRNKRSADSDYSTSTKRRAYNDTESDAEHQYYTPKSSSEPPASRPMTLGTIIDALCSRNLFSAPATAMEQGLFVLMVVGVLMVLFPARIVLIFILFVLLMINLIRLIKRLIEHLPPMTVGRDTSDGSSEKHDGDDTSDGKRILKTTVKHISNLANIWMRNYKAPPIVASRLAEKPIVLSKLAAIRKERALKQAVKSDSK